MTLVFLMLRLLPGDPASYIAGENAPQAAIDAMRESLGLNEPLEEQYFSLHHEHAAARLRPVAGQRPRRSST